MKKMAAGVMTPKTKDNQQLSQKIGSQRVQKMLTNGKVPALKSIKVGSTYDTNK